MRRRAARTTEGIAIETRAPSALSDGVFTTRPRSAANREPADAEWEARSRDRSSLAGLRVPAQFG